MTRTNNKKHGYAILELLFYISFFTIISLVVIEAMITMTRSFKETSIQAEWRRGEDIMERISREIRTAYDINSIGSGNLKLNTKDNDGENITIQFLLSGSDIQFFEDEVLVGNLNTPNMLLSGLTFTQINTTKGKAVKIFFTVESASDTLNRTQDFYNTIVLRGNYQ